MNYRELIFNDRYLSDEYIKDSLRDILEDYPVTLDINYFCLNSKTAKLYYIKEGSLDTIYSMASDLTPESFLVRYVEVKISYELRDSTFYNLDDYKQSLLDEVKLIDDIKFCLVRLPNYVLQTTAKISIMSTIVVRSDVQAVDNYTIKKLLLYKNEKVRKSDEHLR